MESIPFANLLAVIPGHRRDVAAFLRLGSRAANVVPTTVPLRAAVAVVAAVLAEGAGTRGLKRRVFDTVMADARDPDGLFLIVTAQGRPQVTAAGAGDAPCRVSLDLGHLAERLRRG